MTWPIHLCDMTYSYVWHDSISNMTHLLNMCVRVLHVCDMWHIDDMTHSYVNDIHVTYMYKSRDLYICDLHMSHVTWHIYVWHVSYRCMTCYICVSHICVIHPQTCVLHILHLHIYTRSYAKHITWHTCVCVRVLHIWLTCYIYATRCMTCYIQMSHMYDMSYMYK